MSTPFTLFENLSSEAKRAIRANSFIIPVGTNLHRAWMIPPRFIEEVIDFDAALFAGIESLVPYELEDIFGDAQAAQAAYEHMITVAKTDFAARDIAKDSELRTITLPLFTPNGESVAVTLEEDDTWR